MCLLIEVNISVILHQKKNVLVILLYHEYLHCGSYMESKYSLIIFYKTNIS
jgi:hypothetical protein